jgi:very-short-patch-repair endonuclease
VLTGPKPTIQRARKQRQEMSLPEVLLWRVLRGSPEGIRFRRLHPSGRLVSDFYCHKARLVIELDGEIGDAIRLTQVGKVVSTRL